MRKFLPAAGIGFALLNVILWFSSPAIRHAVDAAYGRLDSPLRPHVGFGVQELLVYFDPWLAVLVFPLLFTLGFACIPLLLFETNSETSQPTIGKPFIALALHLLCFLEVVWLFLIWVGVWCRGPNWVFYWPSERWDLSRLEVVNSVNLSEYFWGELLKVSYSGFGWPLRELPGLLLIAVWFVSGIAVVLSAHRSNPRLHRLLAATFLFQIAFLVPLKMACRWLFDLKYFVAIPEFFFNI